jgi:hypothetical protein
MIRDVAKRARLGELYREAWGELMKTPYYRGASGAPPDSREGRMVASARHLSARLGETPGPAVLTGGYRSIQTLGSPPPG